MAASAVAPASNSQFLGAPIKVVTTFGEELEGELFCYDVQSSNSLILRQQLPNGRTNYKWVRSNVIREVSASGPSRPVDEILPAVDLRKAEERAKQAEREAQRNVKNLGVGVTEHAQEVFNAINKTMDCEWDKEDITVFGVRITKPYTPDNCTGGDDNAALERVKKVLQGELDRIKARKSGKNGDAEGGAAGSGGSEEDGGRGGD